MFARAVSTHSLLPSSTRRFSTSLARPADFTHAVIGGGVVGLAIARQLQGRDAAAAAGGGGRNGSSNVSTVLIEKHGSVGQETSSRNSEVIHAGLYYGASSLKTKLCLRGKEMLYEACERHHVPYRNCGKWIVAQDGPQREAIEGVHEFARSVGVPTRFVSKEEAARREPDVRAEAGVLESPSTGIVDSHALMQWLEGEFEDRGGVCAFRSPVTSISSINNGTGGWEITTRAEGGGEETTITAETLINSAGLGAIAISNMIVPEERRRKAYYAKGSYFSYSLSHPKPNILVYPAPVPGHGGLGTHLTLDMGGRIRFGPDVEWVDDPNDYTVNSKNLEAALDDIQSYLPGIDRSAIGLDYVGIRPKLGKLGAVTSGKGFQDFYIRKEEGFDGFINLLGIESPGLTSCLAIAEEVEDLLYR